MTMEQKFDALAAFVLAEEPAAKETARKALAAVMKTETNHVSSNDSRTEDATHQFLMELSAQPHLLGYRYAAYGIALAVNRPEVIDNITGTGGFYQMIAAKFDTTASRVERAIRNLIEKTWMNGDPDTLISFFGLSIKSDKGQPTNAHFIARCAIVIRSRLNH